MKGDVLYAQFKRHKNYRLATTLVGMGAELLSNWVEERKLDEKIDEKIDKALKEREKES